MHYKNTHFWRKYSDKKSFFGERKNIWNACKTLPQKDFQGTVEKCLTKENPHQTLEGFIQRQRKEIIQTEIKIARQKEQIENYDIEKQKRKLQKREKEIHQYIQTLNTTVKNKIDTFKLQIKNITDENEKKDIITSFTQRKNSLDQEIENLISKLTDIQDRLTTLDENKTKQEYINKQTKTRQELQDLEKKKALQEKKLFFLEKRKNALLLNTPPKYEDITGKSNFFVSLSREKVQRGLKQTHWKPGEHEAHPALKNPNGNILTDVILALLTQKNLKIRVSKDDKRKKAGNTYWQQAIEAKNTRERKKSGEESALKKLLEWKENEMDDYFRENEKRKKHQSETWEKMTDSEHTQSFQDVYQGYLNKNNQNVNIDSLLEQPASNTDSLLENAYSSSFHLHIIKNLLNTFTDLKAAKNILQNQNLTQKQFDAYKKGLKWGRDFLAKIQGQYLSLMLNDTLASEKNAFVKKYIDKNIIEVQDIDKKIEKYEERKALSQNTRFINIDITKDEKYIDDQSSFEGIFKKAHIKGRKIKNYMAKIILQKRINYLSQVRQQIKAYENEVPARQIYDAFDGNSDLEKFETTSEVVLWYYQKIFEGISPPQNSKVIQVIIHRCMNEQKDPKEMNAAIKKYGPQKYFSLILSALSPS